MTMKSALAEYWGRLQVAQHFFFRSFFFFKHLPFFAFAKHFAAPFLSSHAASTAASAMNTIRRSSNLLMTAMAKRAAPRAPLSFSAAGEGAEGSKRAKKVRHGGEDLWWVISLYRGHTPLGGRRCASLSRPAAAGRASGEDRAGRSTSQYQT